MTLKELFIKISPNGKEVAGIDLIPQYTEELGDKGINITRQEINEFLKKYRTI
jgi:hypothetical protein